eukprot:Rmarinus@m.2971
MCFRASQLVDSFSPVYACLIFLIIVMISYGILQKLPRGLKTLILEDETHAEKLVGDIFDAVVFAGDPTLGSFLLEILQGFVHGSHRLAGNARSAFLKNLGTHAKEYEALRGSAGKQLFERVADLLCRISGLRNVPSDNKMSYGDAR